MAPMPAWWYRSRTGLLPFWGQCPQGIPSPKFWAYILAIWPQISCENLAPWVQSKRDQCENWHWPILLTLSDLRGGVLTLTDLCDGSPSRWQAVTNHCACPRRDGQAELACYNIAVLVKVFVDFGLDLSYTSSAEQCYWRAGYVWLVRDSKAPEGSQLSVVTTQNQDCPLSLGLDPLLVIDVWEHAYYLKHQFRRVEHVTEWWLVVDWEVVDKLDQFWTKVAAVNFERDEL